MPIDLQKVFDDLRKDYKKGIAERKSDKAAGMDALMKVIGLFDESYGKGTLQRAQAKYAQSAAGRGLAGSTVPAAVSVGLGQEFEDMRRGRLAGALSDYAGYRSSFDMGRASATDVAFAGTGGYKTQQDEAYRRRQEREQSGQRIYSGGGGGSRLGRPPSAPFSRGGNVSGSVADSGGVGGSQWGSLPGETAQQTQQSRRQTISGMWTTKAVPIGPEPPSEPDWDIPEEAFTPDWAEEAAAEQAYQGGWTG